jgi:hypothetical protein
MRHPASKVLYEHWNSLRRGSIVPDRNDLDPAEIGLILQDIFILGAQPGGPWIYRVAGTRLSAFARRELKDEPFDHWWRALDRRDARRIVSGIAEDSAPLIGGVAGIAPDMTSHDFELLLLPLRHGGRAGLRMLGGLFPSQATSNRIGVRIDELGLLSIRTLMPVASQAPVFGKPVADLGGALERRRSLRLIQGGAAG